MKSSLDIVIPMSVNKNLENLKSFPFVYVEIIFFHKVQKFDRNKNEKVETEKQDL